MPVYIDDMRAPFGRMLLCHMIADTTQELLEMADAIGVARKWIQHPGTPSEHFDIALTKRAAAVRRGAVEITWRQCGAMTKRMMVEGKLGKPEEAEEWLQAYWERKKREEMESNRPQMVRG
jgi:hypothetical protein